MYSELINYTDFNGDKVSERLYFNITRTELQKQNMHKEGGLLSYLTRIIATRDQNEIANYFEEIINMSYGVKSDDGKHFIKNKELTEKFMCSAAYDELFYKLTTDSDYAAKFINAIMPQDLDEKDINQKSVDAAKEKFLNEVGMTESELGMINETNNNTK